MGFGLVGLATRLRILCGLARGCGARPVGRPREVEGEPWVAAGVADTKLFNELWAGTLFDLIHAVDTKCPEWEEDEQSALVYMVIDELARRYGVIGDGDHENSLSRRRPHEIH